MGVRDDLLVIGWIRKLFTTSEFEQCELPPLHIIEAMVHWYSMELIHVIEDNGGHYAIPLVEVMNSVAVKKYNKANNRKRKLKDGMCSVRKKRRISDDASDLEIIDDSTTLASGPHRHSRS